MTYDFYIFAGSNEGRSALVRNRLARLCRAGGAFAKQTFPALFAARGRR